MGLTRAERIALHKKQERLQVQKHSPSVSELSEGIPVLRSTAEGLVEYVRYNNQLYKKIYTPENTAGLDKNPTFHVALNSTDGADQQVTNYVATVLFNDVNFDTAGGYDTSTGRYTVQKGGSGLYYINTSVTIDDINNEDYVELRIVHNDNGSDIHYQNKTNCVESNIKFGCQTSVILELVEDDYIYIEVSSDEQDYDVEDLVDGTFPQTWFEGFKIN